MKKSEEVSSVYRFFRYLRTCTLNQREGFSLIELVVILTVISVISAIAFIGLGTWIPNYRLKAAAQEIYADFQSARMHAAKKNRSVSFTFTVDATCAGATSYVFTDSDGLTIVNKDLADGVCMKSSTFVNMGLPNESGFDPKGLPLGNAGKIVLGHNRISRTREISQSSAGTVRIN